MARGKTGLGRREFVRRLDGIISPRTLFNYEHGVQLPPRVAVATINRRLAEASGLPEWVFTLPKLSNVHRDMNPTDARLLEELSRLMLEQARDLVVRSEAATGEASTRPPGSAPGTRNPGTPGQHPGAGT